MIYTFKFFIFHVTLAVISYLGYQLLYSLKHAKNSKLKKYLHISAVKSSNGAVLLGGSVFSVVSFFAALVLMSQYRGSPNERMLLGAWLTSHVILSIVGYLDDRFELRASVKLLGQATSCLIFALIASLTIQSNISVFYFALFFFWGMGVINGVNLLDGIDTLTIKLSLTTYALFFAMGIWFNIPTLPVMSIVFSIPMMVFYLFNKEPSRIQLGEIGGITIGASYLFLATLTFNGMNTEKSFYDFTNSICLAFLPLHLPMVEVGVSFLRRMYNRKSPFIGDRHHVHYIFRDMYNLGATKTATLYSLGHFSICGVMFLLSPFSPLLSFFTGAVIYLLCFFSVGKEFWIKNETNKNISLFNMFRSVKTKEINVINTSAIEKFQIELIDSKNNEDIDKDDKKAA